jgi:hypothetical protein
VFSFLTRLLRRKQADAKGNKAAPRPPVRRKRKPSLMADGPMMSQMESYALGLLTETGQRFRTNAERDDAMHQLVMEIEDAVHEQVYALLDPADRAQAEALAEADRHAFLKTRFGDVEAKITWAMSEFRKHYLSGHMAQQG